jgi:hypothetical protein
MVLVDHEFSLVEKLIAKIARQDDIFLSTLPELFAACLLRKAPQ